MAISILDVMRNFFTGNLMLKALSLLLALFIWSFTVITREARYELSLPVELRHTPPGYSLAAPAPREVHFTISGPYNMIEGARRSNPSVILSLRGAVAPGKTIFSHIESNLKLPDQVKVTRTSPASLEINLIRDHSPEP